MSSRSSSRSSSSLSFSSSLSRSSLPTEEEVSSSLRYGCRRLEGGLVWGQGVPPIPGQNSPTCSGLLVRSDYLFGVIFYKQMRDWTHCHVPPSSDKQTCVFFKPSPFPKSKNVCRPIRCRRRHQGLRCRTLPSQVHRRGGSGARNQHPRVVASPHPPCRGISAFEFCPEVRKPTLDCTNFDNGSIKAAEKCPAVNQQVDHFKRIYWQQS
ncbi:pentatricopeptide (PPR) repeat protein [Actinidia rufa]|uniref:Pentatricopeptide (PPR) repeat protein n=1 Tax=Actinidia rufa TaxID=165716 RepID=A0A7J0GPS6_9ERIC|nr:pentatricopeptide (PPR) repeat protein [Actinidia rufa]